MSQSNLFLTSSAADKAEFVRMMDATVRAIAASMDHGKAYAGMTPENLRALVRTEELLPEKSMGFDELLKEVSDKILPNFLRPSSTNYMAHLHSSVLLESIAAELILSTFNQSMDSWDQSPVATEIEVEVINTLCQLYGYGAGSDGVFTSGGSQSNLMGLMLARDWFCNTKLNYDVKKLGLPENYRKFRIYTSAISHFSMEKGSHLLGLGYDAVVKVPVDRRQKMDMDAFRKLVEQDVAQGNIPFCAVATIGTTDYGSIDDVAEMHKICQEHGMWLHADAAYGSGVIMSLGYKDRIGPLHLCDSITVDFHKMFLMPISCGAYLVKDGKNFETLTLHADYLNREEDEEDGYTNLVGKSMQTTRRFDALKVWLSFQTRGQDGWSQIISTCIQNATHLYNAISSSQRFEAVTEPEISSVVFRVLPAEGKTASDEEIDELNKKVRRALIHQEGVVIGQTVFDGKVYLKFTLLNPRITYEKLDGMLDLIQSLADRV